MPLMMKLDNDGDGLIDEHEINEWVGPDGGYWHDSPSYWSLCQIPNSCNQVIIGPGNSVVIKDDLIANAFSLSVSSDATLELETGSQLKVIQD